MFSAAKVDIEDIEQTMEMIGNAVESHAGSAVEYAGQVASTASASLEAAGHAINTVGAEASRQLGSLSASLPSSEQVLAAAENTLEGAKRGAASIRSSLQQASMSDFATTAKAAASDISASLSTSVSAASVSDTMRSAGAEASRQLGNLSASLPSSEQVLAAAQEGVEGVKRSASTIKATLQQANVSDLASAAKTVGKDISASIPRDIDISGAAASAKETAKSMSEYLINDVSISDVTATAKATAGEISTGISAAAATLGQAEITESISSAAQDASEAAKGAVKQLPSLVPTGNIGETAKTVATEAGTAIGLAVASTEAGIKDVSEAVQKTKAAAAAMAASPLVTDVFAAAQTAQRQIIGDTFHNIEESYTQSRESLQQAIDGLKGLSESVIAKIFPLLRFEIVRDFTQTISLFFQSFYRQISLAAAPVLVTARNIFGSWYKVVALQLSDIQQTIKDSPSLPKVIAYILLVFLLTIYALYLWFVLSARHVHNRSKEVREGHEKLTWEQIAKQKKQWTVKMTKIVITVLLTVYLPLTKICLELITLPYLPGNLQSAMSQYLYENYKDKKAGNNSFTYFTIMAYLGALVLITFTLPLPIMLIKLVNANKPVGTTENADIIYDVDGEPVPFDDKAYGRLLAQDPNQRNCPYFSLYDGFERRWAHYKVFQLFFKVLLVLPLLVLTGNSQAWLSLVITIGVAAATFYTSPFIDPVNDIMESSAKTTALITCLGGAVLVLFPKAKVSLVIAGVIVNGANAINALIAIGCFLHGSKAVKLKMKNIRGTFTFSDTVKNISDGPTDRIVPQWDLERECKHRIWHAFWQGILLNKCGKDVARRLIELENEARESGIENIRKHWAGEADADIASRRMQCRSELEGVDVFWNDPKVCRDGRPLTSKTCFGKMYIDPYPFHCVVVYDDVEQEAFIRDDAFLQFFDLNMSPWVKEKRLVRQKLRTLGRWNGLINLPFSRKEKERVEDGTKVVSYTDSNGNSRTRTEKNYSTVEFECFYTNGVISVSANTDNVMAAGFRVAMTYNDGYGSAMLPKTQQMHHFQNRQAVMGHNHIGLTDTMEMSPRLAQIFDLTAPVIACELPRLIDDHNAYRHGLIQQNASANLILSDGFWFTVFNNANISRQALESYLTHQEKNSILNAIPKDHSSAVDFLYKRINFVNFHPVMRLWYVFWDDFYYQNKDMTCVQPCVNDFDPTNASSICYRLMKREDLEKWLADRKLIGPEPTYLSMLLLRKLFFNPRNLGVLYRQIVLLENPDYGVVKTVGIPTGNETSKTFALGIPGVRFGPLMFFGLIFAVIIALGFLGV